MRSTGSGAVRVMAGSERRARVGSGYGVRCWGSDAHLCAPQAARCTVGLLENNVLRGLFDRCCARVLLKALAVSRTGAGSHGNRVGQ